MDERYTVEIKTNMKSKGVSVYRNVHKIDIVEAGTLRLKISEKTTVYRAIGTWETCRVDED